MKKKKISRNTSIINIQRKTHLLKRRIECKKKKKTKNMKVIDFVTSVSIRFPNYRLNLEFSNFNQFNFQYITISNQNDDAKSIGRYI